MTATPGWPCLTACWALLKRSATAAGCDVPLSLFGTAAKVLVEPPASRAANVRAKPVDTKYRLRTTHSRLANIRFSLSLSQIMRLHQGIYLGSAYSHKFCYFRDVASGYHESLAQQRTL